MTSKLLNKQEIAEYLGCSQWWISQAAKAGMPFNALGKIETQDALTWLKKHSDFVANDWLSKPAMRGGRHQGRPRKDTVKPCESFHLPGQQIA